MAARDVGYGLGVFLQNLVPGLRYAMDKADKEAMMAKQMGMKERQMAGEQAFREAQLEIQKGEAESKDRRRRAAADAEGKKLDPEIEGIKARAARARQQTLTDKERAELIKAQTGAAERGESGGGIARDRLNLQRSTAEKRRQDAILSSRDKEAREWARRLQSVQSELARAEENLVSGPESKIHLEKKQRDIQSAYEAAERRRAQDYVNFGFDPPEPVIGGEPLQQPPKKRTPKKQPRSPPPDDEIIEPQRTEPVTPEIDPIEERLRRLEEGGFRAPSLLTPQFFLSPQQQEFRRRLEAASRFAQGTS